MCKVYYGWYYQELTYKMMITGHNKCGGNDLNIALCQLLSSRVLQKYEIDLVSPKLAQLCWECK